MRAWHACVWFHNRHHEEAIVSILFTFSHFQSPLPELPALFILCDLPSTIFHSFLSDNSIRFEFRSVGFCWRAKQVSKESASCNWWFGMSAGWTFFHGGRRLRTFRKLTLPIGNSYEKVHVLKWWSRSKEKNEILEFAFIWRAFNCRRMST